MADLSALVARLTKDAAIQDSEKFDPEDLEMYVTNALRQHNPDYSVLDLPSEEEELVIVLAWASICILRANKFAKDSNATGAGGFGQDRSTPYYKNMDLSQKLLVRYQMLRANLGLINSTSDIVQGNLVRKDSLLDRLVGQSLTDPPPTPRSLALTAESPDNATGDTYIIGWNCRDYDNFLEYSVFHLEGTSPIIQPANLYSSTGVPRISDSAVLLIDISDITFTQVEVTAVDKTKVNRFLVVNRSRSEKLSYSNELVISPP